MLKDDILIQAIIQEVVKTFFVGREYQDRYGYLQTIPGQLDSVIPIIVGQIKTEEICNKIMEKISIDEIVEKAVCSIRDIVYNNTRSDGIHLKTNIKEALAQKIAEKINKDEEFINKLMGGLDLSQMDISVELKKKKT